MDGRGGCHMPAQSRHSAGREGAVGPCSTSRLLGRSTIFPAIAGANDSSNIFSPHLAALRGQSRTSLAPYQTQAPSCPSARQSIAASSFLSRPLPALRAQHIDFPSSADFLSKCHHLNIAFDFLSLLPRPASARPTAIEQI